MRFGLCVPAVDPFSDRIAFPAQSSVLDEETLLHRVVKDYDIPQVEACRFYDRGDADVYQVITAGPRYYLKIYRPPYTITRVEAEGQLVTDLALHGQRVVRPVRRFDGRFAHEVRASEGMRPLLLYEEAPPPLPWPADESICEQVGRAVAQLHETADVLGPQYPLPVLDCATGVDDTPIDEIVWYTKSFLTDLQYHYVRDAMARVCRRLKCIPRELPAFGLCHADLVLSNVRYDEGNEVTLFDFGAAAYTWRSLELTVFRRSLEQRDPMSYGRLWDAFLAGYTRLRMLPKGLSEMGSDLLIYRQIMWLSANCATLPQRLGRGFLEGDFLEKGIAYVQKLGNSE